MIERLTFRMIARHAVSTCIGLAALPSAAESLTPPVTLIASVQRALASAPGTFSPPTLEGVWANVDLWSKQQRAEADAQSKRTAARFLPPHLRDQNAFARYAENELLLLPQRNVKHAEGSTLRAGAFTVGAVGDVAFADRGESPDSALGVVVEFDGGVTFAGDLPDSGRRAEAQARNLGDLIHAVVPSVPVKITLVALASRPDAQVTEVRRQLGERYAGVPIAVLPQWP